MRLEPEAAPAPETGRLSGKSGCNQYGAGYTLSGEGGEPWRRFLNRDGL